MWAEEIEEEIGEGGRGEEMEGEVEGDLVLGEEEVVLMAEGVLEVILGVEEFAGLEILMVEA